MYFKNAHLISITSWTLWTFQLQHATSKSIKHVMQYNTKTMQPICLTN